MFDVFERAVALQDEAEGSERICFVHNKNHNPNDFVKPFTSFHHLPPAFHEISRTCSQPAESLLSLQASMRRILEGTILSMRMDIHTAMALSSSVPSKGPLGSKMKFKAIQRNSGTRLGFPIQKQCSIGPIVYTCLYMSLLFDSQIL